VHRRAAKLVSFLAPLLVWVLVDLFILPSRWDWKTLAAFCAFTLGFIELIRASMDLRSDDEPSPSVRTLLVGGASIGLGIYFGLTAPGGGRAIGAGMLAALSGWAIAHFLPDDDQIVETRPHEPDNPVDEVRFARQDSELRARGPRI